MKLNHPYLKVAEIPADLLFDAKDEAHWWADDMRQRMGLTTSQSILIRHSPEYDHRTVRNLPMMLHYGTEYRRVVEFLRDFYPIEDIWAFFLVRLPAGKAVHAHADNGHFLHAIHRVHIPITTNPRCLYVIDGESVNMQVGMVYEIDNTRWHHVANDGDTDRVHLVVNIYPKKK